MEIMNVQIVKLENTFFFTYKGTEVINYPQEVTVGNTAVVAKTTDLEIIERTNMDDLMIEFNNLGFIMVDPTQPVVVKWEYPEKPIRLFMSFKDYVNLLASQYGIPMLEYFNNIQPSIFDTQDGKYIYLTELYDEHKNILLLYNCIIENI